MERTNLVMAAMAASESDAKFGPAQLQKLLFLIDTEIPVLVEGPVFNFQPYDYGPFDVNVYNSASELEILGKAAIDHSRRYRTYSLTEQGYQEGRTILETMTPDAQDFLASASLWVRSVSFQEMVSAIYQKYPDTKVNSIFN